MYGAKAGSDTPELSHMYEKCGTMEIARRETATTDAEYIQKYPTVTVTKLPIQIRCMEGLHVDGQYIRTYGTFFAEMQFLVPYNEFGKEVRSSEKIEYKLDVEDNQLVLRRVDQINYIEESGRVAYTLSDEILRYGFSFRGCDLTLTDDSGQSVILSSCINDTQIQMVGEGFLKAGSKTVEDNINSIRITHFIKDSGNPDSAVTAFQCGRLKSDLTESGYGSFLMEDNGRITLALPPLKGQPVVTKQFLYFYLGNGDTDSDGGIILTDGTDIYYYTARFTEGTIGSASMNLSAEDEAAAEKLTPEQLAEIEQKQADLLTDLGAAFREAGLDVNLNPETGEIVMVSNVLFGGDSAELTADAKRMLATFAQTYASVVFDEKYNGFVSKIFVEGHTAPLRDSTYESGLPLSKERAENVAAFCLSDEAGVDPAYRTAFGNMMTAIGYSCGNPVCQANGEPDLEASRRVAFRFRINLKSVS